MLALKVPESFTSLVGKFGRKKLLSGGRRDPGVPNGKLALPSKMLVGAPLAGKSGRKRVLSG